jgi:hypothetical protein
MNIFRDSFAGKGVLHNDPTVYLYGARPAKTYNPPSLLGNVPVQPPSVLSNKSMFAKI